MLFSSSKCPLPALVTWCRALKHSLGAGLDPIKIFRQQGKSGPRALRWVAKEIAGRLEKGDSIEDALDPHRDKFPPLFVELVAVGEQTGRLEAAFDELERYYETTLKVQRDFRSQMIYPTLQYVAAVFIVSALTFVLGMINGKMDALGLGLTGTSGALILIVLGYGPAIALVVMLKMAANNVRFRAQLEGFGLMVPAWGPALKSFALHRFSVALGMCSEAGLRAEMALRYSFRATTNSMFMKGEAAAVAVVKKGGEIGDVLVASRAPFPEEFSQSILVAEETGQMTEVMERISENYREEGSRQLKQAAQFTSWGVYGMVAIIIIIAIFSIANTYIGAVNNAANGM